VAGSLGTMSMFAPFDLMACCRAGPARSEAVIEEINTAGKSAAHTAFSDASTLEAGAGESAGAGFSAACPAISPNASSTRTPPSQARVRCLSPASSSPSPAAGMTGMPVLLGRAGEGAVAEHGPGAKAEVEAKAESARRMEALQEPAPTTTRRSLLRRLSSVARHSAAEEAPVGAEHTLRRRFSQTRSGSKQSTTRMSGIMRTISRRLSCVFHLTPQRPEGLASLSRAAPPEKLKPQSTGRLPAASPAAVREAIVAEGQPLFRRFAAEALGAYDFMASQWFLDPEVTCMSISYVMPAPKDVPDVAKKLISLPSTIGSRGLVWFSVDDAYRQLTLKQRVHSDGVMYSDQFYVEVTVEFVADEDGGVIVRQWVEVFWTKPLPFAMSWLTSSINKRVKDDSVSKFPLLLRLLGELVDAA